MNEKHAFGRAAELQAENHYRESGFYTLARNYRTKGGEIDLVMKKGDLLLFVEVKGRRTGWEPHAWAENWRGKGSRLRATIARYIRQHPEIEYREMRLEVAFVTPTRVVTFDGI